ncbi:MAG TPA: DUF1016 N-terminal domain-containing protein [Acidobacteriaceae bacterium]
MNIRMEPCVSDAKRHPRTISNSRRANFKRLALWTGTFGNLATDLRTEFPGVNGFSAANLWRMNNFYEVYGANEKLAQLVREIGWSHNITILERCRDDQEREFYIRSCRKYGWTRNVLVHKIENHSFQQTLKWRASRSRGSTAQVTEL